MPRHAGAPVCLCGGSGAACHRRHPFVGPAAGPASLEPAAPLGWSTATRSSPAFAVSQLEFAGKTETYEILRHPERRPQGHHSLGRAPGEKPAAELEIYRPGGELSQSGARDAGYRRADEPRAASELEAAGVIDSKFGPVALLRVAGRAERGVHLPRLHQKPRQSDVADVRLDLPGRHAAGPARRDRLHAQSVDAALRRKRAETGRIVRPRRTQARRLRRPAASARLGHRRRKPPAARRALTGARRTGTCRFKALVFMQLFDRRSIIVMQCGPIDLVARCPWPLK